MKEIIPNNKGLITTPDLDYLGGKYGIWERFRIGGIGSPKTIYKEGIDEFDRLKRNISGETAFLNFELFKKGLILRLNMHQRYCLLGMQLAEITGIHLSVNLVEKEPDKWSKLASATFYKGQFELETFEKNLQFSILSRELEGLIQFFRKEAFGGRFSFYQAT